ncbi:MAG: metallophosphoesterase [Solirubrobacteraceae bacterium]|nr:metallophosphoesterase [Solirubrobacteraceae bacterium]
MADAPVFLVQLTDSHLRDDDPSRLASLTAAVDRVLALGVAPSAVIATGDIADQGRASEYADAAAQFARLDAPLVVLPGNKDDRAAMREAFGLPGAPEDRVQSVSTHGGLRIIACDSQIPGDFPGDLDLAWLEEQLAADRLTPTVIAMHHPPYRIGVTALDAMGFQPAQRAALDALLTESPNVLRVIAGHVHRASFGTIGGVPATTASSVSFQIGLDLNDGPVDLRPDEPAAFSAHVLVDGDLVTHVHPVVPAAG